jgi:hypothetical protein
VAVRGNCLIYHGQQQRMGLYKEAVETLEEELKRLENTKPLVC